MDQGRSQRGGQGAMLPNRRLSWFFTEKSWLCWGVGPALFSKVTLHYCFLCRKCSVGLKYAKNMDPAGEFKFWWRRLKKVVNFFNKKVHSRRENSWLRLCFDAQLLWPQCNILATPLTWTRNAAQVELSLSSALPVSILSGYILLQKYKCNFNHFDVVGSKLPSNSRYFALSQWIRSRSFSVTDFCTNGNPVRDFPLVNNTNLPLLTWTVSQRYGGLLVKFYVSIVVRHFNALVWCEPWIQDCDIWCQEIRDVLSCGTKRISIPWTVQAQLTSVTDKRTNRQTLA